MKLYKATGDKFFKEVECENNPPESFVKLKLSLICPTVSDVAIFEGKADVAYPRVPCKMATAIVSEDRDEYGLKLGGKVLLNPYIDADGDEENGYAAPALYGVDEDGFLRDFIALPPDNVVPFPENVREEEAVFADIVAVALKTIKTLKVKKGDYVAVIGGSLLSIVIAQLALYYQAIPVLITSDARYLRLAEKAGIYYTVDESKENVIMRVKSITGGRMAEHTVIHTLPNVSPNYLYNITSHGGTSVIAGVHTSFAPRMECNISEIAGKNLTVSGVTSAREEFVAAINLLAQKIINFDGFIDKTVPLKDAVKLFEELSDDPTVYVMPAIRV